MPITFVPFNGWAPGGSYFGEGWATAQNVYPAYNAVRPWHPFDASASSVLFGPMTGAYAHKWMTGAGGATYQPDALTVFAGSKTRLHTVNLSTGAFTDVSRAAFYGAAVEPAGWRFASVGNDIFATNWIDPVQRRTNNSGAFADGFTSTFLPVPRFLATIREHLVGANLSNAGRFQDELVWSDADNAVDFDPPTGTSTSLAGSKRLTSIPGQVTGLVGGQYGLAFKRSSIFYLEATGTTQIFRPDVLSEHVGTAYGSSIINTRYGLFFLGSDGIYRINGLAAPVKISSAGVDHFLFSNPFPLPLEAPAAATAAQEDAVIIGFQMPHMPLVGWLFKRDWTNVGSDGLLLYNPMVDQWTYSDALPSPLPSTILSLPFGSSLYAPLITFTWDLTRSRLARLDDTDTLEPTFTLRFRPTGVEEDPFRQSMLKGVLPVFSGVDPFAAPALTSGVTVEAALDPFQTSTSSEVRDSTQRNPIGGWYPFHSAGRFFRVSIIGQANEDFENFEGVYIHTEPLK